jgi:hypothetical protein
MATALLLVAIFLDVAVIGGGLRHRTRHGRSTEGDTVLILAGLALLALVGALAVTFLA